MTLNEEVGLCWCSSAPWLVEENATVIQDISIANRIQLALCSFNFYIFLEGPSNYAAEYENLNSGSDNLLELVPEECKIITLIQYLKAHVIEHNLQQLERCPLTIQTAKHHLHAWTRKASCFSQNHTEHPCLYPNSLYS